MLVGEKSSLVWSSKNRNYEKPWCITGASKLTGSKQKPKGICIDRIIGTRKGIRLLYWSKQTKNNKLLY